MDGAFMEYNNTQETDVYWWKETDVYWFDKIGDEIPKNLKRMIFCCKQKRSIKCRFLTRFQIYVKPQILKKKKKIQ